MSKALSIFKIKLSSPQKQGNFTQRSSSLIESSPEFEATGFPGSFCLESQVIMVQCNHLIYLESQVAQHERSLHLKVAHYRDKVAPNYALLAFWVYNLHYGPSFPTGHQRVLASGLAIRVSGPLRLPTAEGRSSLYTVGPKVWTVCRHMCMYIYIYMCHIYLEN